MIGTYTHITELSGFLLTFLLILLFRMNNNTKDYNTKYFKNLMNFNCLLCLGDILISFYNSRQIFDFEYLFFVLIHSFFRIWILQFVILYIISIVPKYFRKLDKFEKTILKIFICSELFMVAGLIFNAFVRNYEILQLIQTCELWSYFNIFASFISCFFFLFVNKEQGVHLRVSRNFFIIIPFIFIGIVIQFSYKFIHLGGFVYSLLLIFIYIIFHSRPIDVNSGGFNEAIFAEDISFCKRKSKDIFVITFKIQDFRYLQKYISIEDIYLQIASIISKIEKLNKSVKSYKISKEQYSFIIEDNENFDSNKYINDILNILKYENNELDKLMHFKLLGMKLSNMKISSRDINKIFENTWEKCEINDFYILNKEDIEIYEYEKDLIAIFNDIFTKNDVNDERVLVYYQPIFNKNTNKFNTMEALTRLKIDGKLIFPDKFINVLEENGLIHKYSLLVLEKICMHIKNIQKVDKYFEGVSINFSSEEFKMNSFEKDILDVIKKYDINPNLIRIELTESTDYTSQMILEEKIMIMQEKGFKFYLDDFGTGYSNISKLAYLKFDIIKIDKSLVWDSMDNAQLKNFLQDLTSFISSMKMEVLFEGIENEEMSKLINDVNYFQGYLYSKPLPENEVIEFLKENNK